MDWNKQNNVHLFTAINNEGWKEDKDFLNVWLAINRYTVLLKVVYLIFYQGLVNRFTHRKPYTHAFTITSQSVYGY